MPNFFGAACIEGAGSVCFWEFSGYEPYLATYDQLLGDANCVYMIVVSCKDSTDEQRRQFQFWLDFLRCHVTLCESIGTCTLILLREGRRKGRARREGRRGVRKRKADGGGRKRRESVPLALILQLDHSSALVGRCRLILKCNKPYAVVDQL